MRLLVSGGGTGGHVYPVLAVVSDLLKTEKRVDLAYIGRAGSIEERLADQAKIPFRAIRVGGIRGLAAWVALRNLFQLFLSTRQVRGIIREFKPDVILVSGGYISAPSIWAGATSNVPSVIYLPDLEPGWAIRATARWATRIAVSFDEVSQYFSKEKTVVTGYPVRAEFYQTDKPRARRAFQLAKEEPIVTILGGSRGARAINQATVANLRELTELAQVIHIAGRDDELWVNAQVNKLENNRRNRVRVFGYLDEQLPDALAAADLVVARGGAATLGEFPALGLPSILVPYPYAGKHQESNVEFLVRHGAAIRLENAALEMDLVPSIRVLLREPGKLESMSRAARKMARPDAAHNIAVLVCSLARGRA